MTQPIGRTSDGIWIASDAAQRDAIGSNDALEEGQICRVGILEFVCQTVIGGDSSSWIARCSVEAIANVGSCVVMSEQFVSGVASSISGQSGYRQISSAGGTASVETTTTGFGITGAARLTLPTTSGAEDGAGIRQQTSIFGADEWSGVVRYAALVEVDNPPAAGQEYEIGIGIFQAESVQRLSSDGVYFFATDASPNWHLRHTRATSNDDVDTGVPVATATIQKLEFEVDVAAGTVDGRIDGGALFSVPTPANIQPNQISTSEAVLHADTPTTRGSAVALDIDEITWSASY